MKSCIVLFTTVPEYWDDEKTKPLHSYFGSFFHKNPIYPNENWKDNNNLHPSLMNRSIMDFKKGL